MCNAWNHNVYCDCGFGGDIGGGGAGGGAPMPSIPSMRWGKGSALTYPTKCWWCGETAFFYRSEHGGSALFEHLGWPWPYHSCWERHREQQTDAVRHYHEEFGPGRRVGTWHDISDRRTHPGIHLDLELSGLVLRRFPNATPRLLRSSPNSTGLGFGVVEVSDFRGTIYSVLLPVHLIKSVAPNTPCRVTASWFKVGRRWYLIGQALALPGPSDREIRGLKLVMACRQCGKATPRRDENVMASWGIDPDGQPECATCGRRRGPVPPAAYQANIQRDSSGVSELKQRVAGLLRNPTLSQWRDVTGSYIAAHGDFRPTITVGREGWWHAKGPGGRWGYEGRWVLDGDVVRLVKSAGLWLSIRQAEGSDLWVQVDQMAAERAERSILNDIKLFRKDDTLSMTQAWHRR